MTTNRNQRANATRPANPLSTRDALARLPEFTQRFWTWLTGIARPQEMSRRRWTPAEHLAVTSGLLIGAAILGTASAQALLHFVNPYFN